MENIEESTASSSLIALKYGFIGGILSFMFSILVDLFGLALQFQESIGWISFLWTVVLTTSISIFCLFEYRRNNQGFISYGQALGLTALLGALSGLVTGGFNYIYIEFIDNTVIQRQMELVVSKLEERGASVSDIKKYQELSAWMYSAGAQFVSIVIGSVFIYFLLGLIVSAIAKREKPIFD